MLGDSWWQMAVAVGLALLLTQFAFLAHDAAHRQIFTSGKRNDVAALILGNLFAGSSAGWWNSKHNKHHAAPNQIGRDPDIESGALAFTASDAVRPRTPISRWLIQRQGLYFFPLMALLGLDLQVSSYRRLLARESPDRLSTKRRIIEVLLLTVRHLALLGFVFTVMSVPVGLAFLGIHLLIFGWYLGMCFAPNHIGRPIVPATVKIDFLRRQVLMSRNITGGRLTSFFMGGLNLQIEHHLFPSMSRRNLRRAAPIVAAYCQRLGVTYHQTTPAQAYREVAAYVHRVGWGQVDLWRCPLAGALGRS